MLWLSASTKVEGLSIKPSTFVHFAHESAPPPIAPAIAARLATLAGQVLSLRLAP